MKTPLNDHEQQMLLTIAGINFAVHGYPIRQGLAAPSTSRLLNLHWQEIQRRGITPPADGRTDDRTMQSLIQKKILIGSGSTKDRRVRLSREGVIIAWSLNGEPPSQLKKALAHVQRQIDKKAVTFTDGLSAAVYPRAAGFSDCFTALSLLNLIEIGWAVNCPDPKKAYYAITTTTTPSDWPNDSDLPSWAAELQDSFTSGIEEGERLALSPLGHDLKNECRSLKQCQIKAFSSERTRKDFEAGRGNFSLDF
jgi:hypothetical protein